MQVENQLSRVKEVSLFPWVKVLKKKFLNSFPEIKVETLFVLHENISEEFQNLLTKPNRPRTRTFYRILSELYLHFFWKINWNVECDVKSTCILILYYMSHVGLILSKGNVSSEWFSQILTVLQCVPGDPFVVCDVLLLFRNMKKKYHYAYSEILRSLLFHTSMKKPPNSECFVKTMLLFRRLKFLSKKNATKREVTFFASKIKCPSGTESWLSSLKIKGLHNIKCSKVTQTFLKKNLSCIAVKKLLKVLFANKYHIKLNFSGFQFTKIQQNVTENIKLKNIDKKQEKAKEKPNAQACKFEMALNKETIPQKQCKNNFKKTEKLISFLNNTPEENKTAISSELKSEKRVVSVKQSDYQYFNSPEINFSGKNSTAISRKSKRKLTEMENINKAFLGDSMPISLKLKKRKVCKEVNAKAEESNSKQSSLLDDDTSDKSVADLAIELTTKCENATSASSVNSKNASEKTGLIHSETQNQFSSFTAKADLQKHLVENKSVVSFNTCKTKMKSKNISIHNKPHKFSTKRILTESCSENDSYINSKTSLGVYKEGNILDTQETSKYCKNSLVMSQGHLMHTKNSEYSITDVHKNNCPEIFYKNDLVQSSDNEDRSLVVQKVPSEADECENKLVNYSSYTEDTKIVVLDHLQASANSTKSSISPSKLQISEKKSENRFQLYNTENNRNQDIRTIHLLSPSVTEEIERMHSSHESLNLKTVPSPPVLPVVVNSSKQPKIIYSTFDSSLKYTDEDDSHKFDEKDIQNKLSKHNPKAETSEISKSKYSKRKLRKKVISKEFIESSSGSDAENVSKNEAKKTLYNSNCVLLSKTGSESFGKRNSVPSPSKNEIVIDSLKCSMNYSEKQKKGLKDLTSGSKSDLHSNPVNSNTVFAEQTKPNRSIEIRNEVLCPEQINRSNLSAVSDSSKMQTDIAKRLSSTEGNVSQNICSSAFTLESSLVDNSSKNSIPMPVCLSESLDLQSVTSGNKLEKYFSKFNNSSFNSDQIIHKQLNDTERFQDCQDVSSLEGRLHESVSDDNFDHPTGALRASLPVQATKAVDDVHNSDSLSCLQNKRISQDSENNILTSLNNFKILNNSPTFLPNQESFPELKNLKLLKEVKIILHDCLASQNNSASSSPKTVTENFVSLKKDEGVSFSLMSKQKKFSKRKKGRFVLNPDSNSTDDKKNLEAQCSSSTHEDSLNTSKSSSFQSELPYKAKYKRCFLDSDCDASVDGIELQNSPSYSTNSVYSLRKRRTLSKKNPQKIILETEEHSNCKKRRSPSQVLYSPKGKDFILESASEDNYDHSEYSSRNSPSKLSSYEVNPRDFILESASEDNDNYSEYSSRSFFSESRSSTEAIHSNFILNSASEDNFDNDETEYLSRSPSPVSQSFRNDESENFISGTASEDNASNLVPSSRSPSLEFKPFKKMKSKTFILESTSEDNADNSVSSSRSSSPEFRFSNKVNSKNLVSESAYENNGDKSVSLSGRSSTKFRPCNIKSKTFILESETEDNADNSMPSSISSSPEFQPSNKVKSRTLVFESASEDNADNSICSSRNQPPALRTSNKTLISDVNFDFSSHAVKTSPIKINQEFGNLHSSKESISDFPACLLDKDSETKEESFSGIKAGHIDKFKELQVNLYDCLKAENSSVSLSSRKQTMNSAVKGTDADCLLSFKRKSRRGRRISKKFVSESESDSLEDQNGSKSKLHNSQNLGSSSFQFKSSRKAKYQKSCVDSDNFAIADQNALSEKSAASHNHSTCSSGSSFLEKSSVQVNCGPVSEDNESQKYMYNKSTSSTEKQNNLDITEINEDSFEPSLDLVKDIQEKMEDSSDFVQNSGKVLDLQKNLQFSEEIMMHENTSTLNQLKSSVGCDFEQSFVNNSGICYSTNGDPLQKKLPNLNNVSPRRQESNFLPKVQNSLTKHKQDLEGDKNICNLVISEKEQHLDKDSFLDSNYLNDENFVQNFLDKIDPSILSNEDYLNSFVDRYLISPCTHTAVSENTDNNYNLKRQTFNENCSLSKSVIPYSNAVNKSSQQKSELMSNASTTDAFSFHKINEKARVESNKMECDALAVRNGYKNVCLNSNLNLCQTLDENTCQKFSSQCLNSYHNTELQQLDFDVTTEKGINLIQNSDTLKHFQQNSDIASLVKTSKQGTHFKENSKTLEPIFCKMDFEEALPDTINMSLNSETSPKESEKNAVHDAELNCSDQPHLNDSCTDTFLNVEENLVIKQANLNNTGETSEKILFVCDVENKTCLVHIMPQHLLVTYLNKLGNVTQNQTPCSSNNRCNCPLCCYSSPAECNIGEISKNCNTDRTQMGHIYVNGIKLLTSSLFPVVNLGKRCDETETVINNNVEKESTVSSSSKVLEQKQINTKSRCLVKSNSENIVPENCQKKVLETRKRSLSSEDSSIVKKESNPKKNYNLRKRSRLKCWS